MKATTGTKKNQQILSGYFFFALLKAVSLLIYWPTNAFMLLINSVHNRLHLGHVVRVLASAHQEFQGSREVLDPRDLPEIMDLKDPWAQEVAKGTKDLVDPRDQRDQGVQQEERVNQVLVVSKVPRELLVMLLVPRKVTGSSAFLRI